MPILPSLHLSVHMHLYNLNSAWTLLSTTCMHVIMHGYVVDLLQAIYMQTDFYYNNFSSCQQAIFWTITNEFESIHAVPVLHKIRNNTKLNFNFSVKGLPFMQTPTVFFAPPLSKILHSSLIIDMMDWVRCVYARL